MKIVLSKEVKDALFHYLAILFGIIDTLFIWSMIYIFFHLPYDTYLKWDSRIIFVLSYYVSLRVSIRTDREFSDIFLRFMQAQFFFGPTLKVLHYVGKDADGFDITLFWRDWPGSKKI
ncbi:hypothetical protein I302_107641 [Kwoniella bestiolae CBS 10118]|uniref:Uncharacterized protein n=1 Tax=Kwoniella bestiolae CBS 10118 TaxID=1296100 RepID=A0A1B9FXY9_9TREE|nr:hypothetical protein I302_06620 [Kwoniella bestiolae CBS 10118]OCF23637.1 hypothetical protein I302_06620 [Kwoniella bestiolae CBS 10118]